MSEWRVVNPHQTSTDLFSPGRIWKQIVDIREYDDRPGSRFICEATPEDAERIVEAVNAHAEAERTIAALTSALEFYANEDNYLCRPFAEGLGGLPIIDQDAGDRARAALAAGSPDDRGEAVQGG